MKSEEDIKYFEFEGQGIFVISHNNIDEIYLSVGASKVLDMEAGKKISSKEFMSQMKNIFLICSKYSNLQKNRYFKIKVEELGLLSSM